jgi:hypothetical protein
VWSVLPGSSHAFNQLVTWKLPTQYQFGTAYIMDGIEVRSLRPYIISWLVAKGNRVSRFQCGPSTTCYSTSPDLIISPVNASRPIQAFIPLVAGDFTRIAAVSTDYAAVIYETTTAIQQHSLYSWSNQPWRIQFPVDHITGLVSSATKALLIALAPTDPTQVGYVVKLANHNDNYSFSKVTMFQSSTKVFNAWSSPNHPNPIYYWLEQTPYNGSLVRNAFVKSSGGGAFNPDLAGTVFAPDQYWSTFFIADTYHRVGLLLSGNESKAGFTAWVPVFGMGVCTEEVHLRQPSYISGSTGFSLPSWGTYVHDQGRMATAVSKNLNDNISYLVVLNFVRAPLPYFNCQMLASNDKKDASSTSSSSLPSSSSSSSTSSAHFDSSSSIASTLVEIPEHELQLRAYHSKQTSLHRFQSFTQDVAFKPNCRPSSCTPDEVGDCEETKCWGLGGQGGFFCCEHTPT